MPENVADSLLGHPDYALLLSPAVMLYFKYLPEPQKYLGQINPTLHDFHSDPMKINSVFRILGITD
jgi:hypothetical protein